MTTALLLILTAFAGVCFALQGPLNAALARHLSGSFVAAVCVSYLVGAAVAVVPLLVTITRGVRPGDMAGAPIHVYASGCCGLAGVLIMTFVVPRLGVASLTGAIMFGQLGCALAIDHFGLLGTRPSPAGARQALGIVLMSVAVWLLRR